MWLKTLFPACAVVVVALALAGCVPEPGVLTPSLPSSAAPSVTPSASAAAPTPAQPSVTAAPTPTVTPSAGAQTPVDVTIVTLDVHVGVLEATGIVTGAVEDGSTCTLIISRGSEERTATAASTAGRESTNCGLMTIPVGELAPGAWDAVIEYSSDGFQGRSASQGVTVQ